MPKTNSSQTRSIPWLWIAGGASAVWALFLLVMGFDALVRNREQHTQGPILAMQAVDGPPVGRDVKPKADPALAEPPEEPVQGANDVPEMKKEVENIFVDCAQIGTNIRFVKDPPEAFKRAQAESKIVFVMHLSGNLEDKDFT